MIIEKWKNACAYTIGKYHISTNLPCQDRTLYLEANGVKVMTLADGAGSEENSHIGATIVCEEMAKLLTTNFDDYLMYFENQIDNAFAHKKSMNILSNIIINNLVQKLKFEAARCNFTLKELSSTLLFFAVKDNYYICGHIGDGVIIGLYTDNNVNRIKVLSEPENGEESHITFFVTNSDAKDHLRMKAGNLDNLTGVIMSSDGAGDVLYKNKEFDPSVYELFEKTKNQTSHEYSNILKEYLEKIIANYSNDDLSINLMKLEFDDTNEINSSYEEYLLRTANK